MLPSPDLCWSFAYKVTKACCGNCFFQKGIKAVRIGQLTTDHKLVLDSGKVGDYKSWHFPLPKDRYWCWTDKNRSTAKETRPTSNGGKRLLPRRPSQMLLEPPKPSTSAPADKKVLPTAKAPQVRGSLETICYGTCWRKGRSQVTGLSGRGALKQAP